MRKVIIPIQSFFMPVHFIAIGYDQIGLEIQFFPQTEPDTVGEKDFSLDYTRIWTIRPNGHCGTFHCRAIEQLSYELAVAG
jgi:hypothetical protein